MNVLPGGTYARCIYAVQSFQSVHPSGLRETYRRIESFLLDISHVLCFDLCLGFRLLVTGVVRRSECRHSEGVLDDSQNLSIDIDKMSRKKNAPCQFISQGDATRRLLGDISGSRFNCPNRGRRDAISLSERQRWLVHLYVSKWSECITYNLDIVCFGR